MIRFTIFFVLFLFALSLQAQPKNRLRLFCQGIVIGYEQGFSKTAAQVFVGHTIDFRTRSEDHSLCFDSYFLHNFRSGRSGLNSTITYRYFDFVSVSYSSDLQFSNGRVSYRPGIGINYDVGGMLTAGPFYYFDPKAAAADFTSYLGLRIMLRPVMVLCLVGND